MRDGLLARAAARTIEALEQRTLFGFFYGDPADETPAPMGPDDCPPVDANAGASSPSTTGDPVRHFDGHPLIESADLSSSGFGFAWGHTRHWSGLNNASLNGNGWSIAELPYVVVGGGALGTADGSDAYDPNNTSDGVLAGTALDQRLSIVVGGGGSLTFDAGVPSSYTNGTYTSYQPWGAHQHKLEWDKTNRLLKLTDAQGNVTEFYDVRRASDVTDPNNPYYALRSGSPTPDPDRPIPYSRALGLAQKYGQFKRFIAANGSAEVVAAYDSNGYLTSVTRSDSSTNERERYAYNYTGDTGFAALTNDLVTAAGGTPPKLIARVTLERSDDGGSNWSTVRRVDYTYYTGRVSNGSGGWTNDANGRLGDLKLAQVKDASGATIDTKYYRYYKFTGEAANNVSSQGPTNQRDTTGGPAPLDNGGGWDIYNRYVQSGLKSVTEGPAFDRLAAALTNYDTASDTTIEPYVNHYFEYERWADHVGSGAGDNWAWRTGYRLGTRYRVTKEIAQGAGCSTCSGGQGTYKIDYVSNYNPPETYDGYDPTGTIGFNQIDYNVWRMRTTESLPDTTSSTWDDNDQRIVYTNEVGLPMLEVLVDRNGTTTTSDDKTYRTFYRYDDDGRLILKADPSAVTGHDEGYFDLLNEQSGNFQYLSDNAGLIETTEYADTTTATGTTTGTDGDVAGYFKSASIQRGETGASVLQRSQTYFKRDAGGVLTYPVASVSQYRNAGGADEQKTNYTYTWLGSTSQIASMKMTAPTVSAGQNGPGTADEETSFYDVYGRVTWHRDGDGFITRTKYDADTGGVTEQVADVNTATTSDEPSGWTTPTGGGLHLVTSSEVDGLGRTTKLTDPNGNVSYTVYKDAQHEVRVYRGWQPATNTTTGPVEVVREYRQGTPDGDGDGRVYREVMTFAPSTIPTSNGRPTGDDVITAGSIQSLVRSLTNNADQVVKTDSYFSLDGVTYSQSTVSLGSASNDSGSGNYHRTRRDYDGRGRLKRTESASGTVTRTLYDARGLLTSTWVGTDDTDDNAGDGTTFWSPSTASNAEFNLIEVASNEYDNGGVGDGNLTKTTVRPGGSAADRATTFHYDWRNRLVAAKQGAEASESSSLDTQRQITYRTLDNLGQATAVEQYDGDNISITDGNGDGVPDKPADAARRAKTSLEYDEQGRLFRTTIHSVDQATGSATSGGLVTNAWYDRRGNVAKTSEPGGLVTKTIYDGANRSATVYTTDGGGDGGWTDADDVAGDKVLEHVETAYDANGNPILVTTRQRFHDATDTGALGNPSSGAGTAKARVSYVGMYYDAGDRQTALMDFGTNGGTLDGAGAGADLDSNNNGVADRPSTVAARSDTVLVTSYAYDAGGRLQDITDPKAVVDRTMYDLLGRTTKVIEAHTDGTPSDSDDRTTAYTYTGNNDVLTMKAVLPGGAFQETKYVYGVSQSNGSNIDSNDILAATQYPNKSTGSASSGEQEVSKVNALGEKISFTDRNGNVHAYGYDVLGRLISDEVATLGTGINGDVRELGYTYDAAGRPEKFTSYNSSVIVNEVQRAYNGFGQLVTEYQEHGGSVSTSTSPKVQYAFTELVGGNHSRLMSVTYPNGRTLRYEYASGLDSDISRLSFLADDSSGSIGTHLEEYSFLGLGTVVERKHPEPSLNLTYVKKAAEGTGDAGDQYIGLDRFGRVVDQRWVDLNGAGDSDDTDADRFGYAYDRNSNRTARDWTATGAPMTLDEAYTYDNLDRLTKMNRGTLASGTISDAAAAYTRNWNGLDALGNWDGVVTDADGGGSGSATTETRTHNQQNQIETISGATAPTHDDNGNMTGDEAGKDFVYDAWNRLVQAKDASGSEIKSYEVDALGRRITADPMSGATTDLYYSDQWQVLEEREGATAATQYVWSPVYVDAMVLRDQIGSGGGGTTAGALDDSFSGDGKVTVNIGASDDEIRSVRQSDGKIVVLGSAGGNLALARFNTDGTLDTSFSSDGITTLTFGGTELGQGLAIQSDGKIVVVGQTSSGSDAVVARFNTNGSLDTSFDGDGKKNISFASSAGAVDVAIESSGKLLVAIWTGGDQVVMRLTSSGALDTTYAGGVGYRTVDVGGGDLPQRMALDGSGRLVVSGFSDLGDATLFRLTTSGDLDTTFSTDGKMLVDFGGSGDEGAGVAIDASGRIVIGGTGGANADLVAARVLADGTLDASFSGDGLAYADFGPGADEGEDLMIDANGKIVVGGTADGDTAMAVARFNADGTLDTSFDTDGKVRIDFAAGTTYENAEAMTLQADGKIVIAGRVGNDFAVARLHAETTGADARHYVVQDANFNVTAIADSSGAVIERYAYAPYGAATVLDANWAADADGQSDVAWQHLHQGGRYDVATGLYHFNVGGKGREYSATLGRWVQQDRHPAGPYVDGMSFYEYVGSGPTNYVDPQGTSLIPNSWKHGWGGALPAIFGFADPEVQAAFDQSNWDRTSGAYRAAGGKPYHIFNEEDAAKGECFATCWAQKMGDALGGWAGGKLPGNWGYPGSLPLNYFSGTIGPDSILDRDPEDIAGAGVGWLGVASNKYGNDIQSRGGARSAWHEANKPGYRDGTKFKDWADAERQKNMARGKLYEKAGRFLAGAALIREMWNCYKECEKCPDKY